MTAELLDLPDEVAAWHPAPEEWCVKECLGHILEADQRGFDGRIRAILATSEPTFEAWDQAAVARQRNDCHKPTAELVDEFSALRRDSVTLVQALTEADLDRGGTHPEVGHLVIGDLLHEWLHHDRNHFRQLLANVQAYVWPSMGNAQRFSQELPLAAESLPAHQP